MKKHIITVPLLIILAMILSCTAVFGAENEFVIENGVLTAYNGTSAAVTIPDGVTSIAPGAFAEDSGLLRVTIESLTCTFVEGSFPKGVTIRAYEGSAAESAAGLCNLEFEAIVIKKYKLTIAYVYENGSVAAESKISELVPGESYSVESPAVNGYTADNAVISGIMSEQDTVYTVVYKKNLAEGWTFEGGKVKYCKNNTYVKNETVNEGGKTYSFDSAGYLKADKSFVEISGKTYYFVSNSYVTGYRLINGAIYCFDGNGAMIAGASKDGYDFDINGRMIGDSIMVNFAGNTYYMKNNMLQTGFAMFGNHLYYFNPDYAMVKNGRSNGYTFDSEGHLTSGLSISQLTISQLPDVSADGREQCPKPTVKFQGFTLIENVHYTLEYSDNVEPGSATVLIKGMGPVSGSVEKSFQILDAEAFTLTIKYVNTMGMSVSPIYTTRIEAGEQFNIPSPEVDGYTPDQKSASGTMGNSDMTITITYSKVSSSTEDEQTSAPVESEPNETEKAPENNNDENSTSVQYDYALFLEVFAIATILAGGTIIVIINWDLIKKYFAKKKALIAEKKGKSTGKIAAKDKPEETTASNSKKRR